MARGYELNFLMFKTIFYSLAALVHKNNNYIVFTTLKENWFPNFVPLCNIPLLLLLIIYLHWWKYQVSFRL